MIQQLELTDYVPPARSRRGEPVAAFVIEGDPQVWKRPKPMVIAGHVAERFQGAYRKWRSASIRNVAAWWLGRGNLQPIRTPLIMEIIAVHERPAKPPTFTIAGEVVRHAWEWVSRRMYALVVGDVDNYAKAVLDVMQREHGVCGPMLADDRFVVRLEVEKVYAAVGEEPRTEVRMWRAS